LNNSGMNSRYALASFFIKYRTLFKLFMTLFYAFFFNLQPLKNLKVMNLRSSSKLSLSDSDLSKFPNLEVLNLGQCRGLAGLPSSIKYSTRLTELILYRCDSLSTLPSSIGCLSQLVK
jgi:Leucine-rich repeat (LRR) protein